MFEFFDTLTGIMSLSPPQIKSWLPGSDPVVLTYFCHLSTSLSPKLLLSNLCHEIHHRYQPNASSLKQNLDNQDCHSWKEPSDEDAMFSFTSKPKLHCQLSNTEAISDCQQNTNVLSSDIVEHQKQFCFLLSLMPSTKRPLLLILNGLDHMKNHFGSQIIGSFPSPLPPNVKVILSVSPNSRHILKALGPQPPQEGLLEADGKKPSHIPLSLGMADRKGCLKMLASLLSSSGRKVTSGQQALVNRALTSCSLTLYVRLLHLHISLWHSGRP